MRGEWISVGKCHVFGRDVPHDNGMISLEQVIKRETDPRVLIPMLFAQLDEGFAARVRPGDFIIAGTGFGAGKAHTNAYIAMEALDLRVLCESTFRRVVRATANLALPMMAGCVGIASMLRTGDDIEVDMTTGDLRLLRTGERHRFPPVPGDMREVIERGGREGVLRNWLRDHAEMGLPHPMPHPTDAGTSQFGEEIRL